MCDICLDWINICWKTEKTWHNTDYFLQTLDFGVSVFCVNVLFLELLKFHTFQLLIKETILETSGGCMEESAAIAEVWAENVTGRYGGMVEKAKNR